MPARLERSLRGARAQASGLVAEEAVADFLVAAGYQLIARNRRFGRLELDIVARKGEVIAVVEVRQRGPLSLEGALSSVNLAKQRRLRTAAQLLWREFERDPTVDRIRMDVAIVTLLSGSVQVELVESAF